MVMMEMFIMEFSDASYKLPIISLEVISISRHIENRVASLVSVLCSLNTFKISVDGDDRCVPTSHVTVDITENKCANKTYVINNWVF